MGFLPGLASPLPANPKEPRRTGSAISAPSCSKQEPDRTKLRAAPGPTGASPPARGQAPALRPRSEKGVSPMFHDF
jgi:hypothetical protein